MHQTLWPEVRAKLTNSSQREAQDTLFESTLTELQTKQSVAVEGPTGVGKSLLAAPMLDIVLRNGGRLIYSPRTKAQQDMVESETIPRMSAFLPNGHVVLKGRTSYLCERRAKRANIKVTPKGDDRREDHPELLAVWDKVCSDADEGCSNSRCGFSDAYNRARDKAKTASMIITNQSVLALDHKFDGKILNVQPFDALVVDEAHLLPGVLEDQLGAKISAGRFTAAINAATKLHQPDAAKLLQAALNALTPRLLPGTVWSDYDCGVQVRRAVKEANAKIRPTDDDLEALKGRLSSLATDLYYLTQQFDTHSVVMLKEKRSVVVQARKFDVTEDAQRLAQRYYRAVFMSATMRQLATTALGMDASALVRCPQPFNLRANRMGFITGRTVPANSGAHQWSAKELVELVTISKGGALVVATSNEQKDRAATTLMSAGFRVGVQQGGGEDVPPLVAALKAGTIDVAVGVDSVGTGIDIPGDALRLVVLLSAFNPNPYDDLHLKLKGQRYTNPWPELFSRMAAEKLHQSIGRLLRTPNDRGIVAFLDPRQKPIGEFKAAMGMSHVVTDLRAITNFLSH